MSLDHREGQALLVDYDSSEDEFIQSPLAQNSQSVGGLPSNNVNQQQSGESNDGSIKVYKRRWYILMVFSCFSCTYSAVWNCWGPIASAAEVAFGWHDSTIALLTNLGPIAYMASGFVFPWFLQERGLRWSMLISVFLLGIGNTLRSLSSQPSTATVLIYIGQGLNGLIGPMAMAAIPQVSSIWFPPHERVTATSISNSFCIFGYALSFLIGPALVSDVKSNSTHGNKSQGFSPDAYVLGLSGIDAGTNNSGLPGPIPLSEKHVGENVVETARNQIMRYMYMECAWTWFLFVAISVYFPARPPLPPGRSAVASRDHYWAGLWSLKSKLGFLLVAFCYGISTGVTAGWAAMLSVTLKPFNVDQKEAGWIGFYSISGSCVIALLLCRFADHFIRHIKVFIVFLYSLGTSALLVFALITIHAIPFHIGVVYLVVIAGFTLTNGAIPLLFELACELAYPTSESAANGFLTFLNNFFCLLFLLVLSIPDVGVEWEHWTVVASCCLCIPLIVALKSRFNRLDLDELEQSLVVDSDKDPNLGPSGGHNTTQATQQASSSGPGL